MRPLGDREAHAQCGWCVRDDVCTQPVPQDALHVLTGPPWRVVVEQQGDERLDREDTDKTALIPQSLVDEACKALQTLALLRAQFRPCIAKQRLWITEREERLAGHVPQRWPWPALTTVRRRPVVERTCRAMGLLRCLCGSRA